MRKPKDNSPQALEADEQTSLGEVAEDVPADNTDNTEQLTGDMQSKAYVILNYGGYRSMSYEDDVDLLAALQDADERSCQTLSQRKAVVVLQSNGGNADVAYKMANLMRRFFNSVDIVVPFRAKSAATLFCMCADCLVMGPISELGPLDVQTEHPGTESSVVSGLDVSQALNNVIATAWLIGESAALAMRRGPGLSRKDALTLGTQFGAAVVQGLISQIDPVAVSSTERALNTALEYGRRLLKRYMFKDSPERIDPLIQNLVNRYPTHTFAIDADEAKDLGLNVTPSGDYADYGLCNTLYLHCSPTKDTDMKLMVILGEDILASEDAQSEEGISDSQVE